MKKQGALTEGVYYILLSLHNPLHGYGIIKNVEEITDGRVVLAAGTLYGAINSLLKKEWIVLISEEVETGKKEYVITDKGKIAFDLELNRLKELVKNGESII